VQEINAMRLCSSVTQSSNPILIPSPWFGKHRRQQLVFGNECQLYFLSDMSFGVVTVSFDGFLDIVKQVTIYWLTLNVPSPME